MLCGCRSIFWEVGGQIGVWKKRFWWMLIRTVTGYNCAKWDPELLLCWSTEVPTYARIPTFPPKDLINSSNLISTSSDWSVSVRRSSKQHPRLPDDEQSRKAFKFVLSWHLTQGHKFQLGVLCFLSSRPGFLALWGGGLHDVKTLSQGRAACDVFHWLLHCREAQHWSDLIRGSRSDSERLRNTDTDSYTQRGH